MTIHINQDDLHNIMISWDELPNYTANQVMVLINEYDKTRTDIVLGQDLSIYKNRFGLYPTNTAFISLPQGQYSYLIYDAANVPIELPQLTNEAYTGPILSRGTLQLTGAEATPPVTFTAEDNNPYIVYEDQ